VDLLIGVLVATRRISSVSVPVRNDSVRGDSMAGEAYLLRDEARGVAWVKCWRAAMQEVHQVAPDRRGRRR